MERCSECGHYDHHETLCPRCYSPMIPVDFSDERECENFLMYGATPAMYKPAIRAFRECRKGGATPQNALGQALRAMIDMLSNH